MLYLYAIIDKPGLECELPRGLEDAQLEVLPFDGLGVVAGPLRGKPSADAANAHRHMDVLKTLMGECTVLPTRFGAVFGKREQLDHAVTSQHGTLAADLERLRGQVELAIRVVDRRALILAPIHDEGVAASPMPPQAGEAVAAAPIYDAEPEMGPGLRYITSRRAESDRRALANTALATEVIEHFAALTTDTKWRTVPFNSGRPAVSMAILLPRDAVEAFQQSLEELRRARPKLEIACTGPWPPYSFVKASANAFAQRDASGEVPDRIAS